MILSRPRSLARALLRTARPRQWVKNAIVLAGLIFSRSLLHWPLVWRALAATVTFILVSSAVYFLNDLLDVEQDRRHPLKRGRPIASGELSPALAAAVAALLFGMAGLASLLLGLPFAYTVLGYVVLQVAYSTVLKQVVIVDVLAIALGFVLRAAAGAVVIHVPISPWLLVCTVLLALFLALTKRRHELTLLQTEAVQHRPILEEYSVELLDQMINVVTASTVMAYTLYTFNSSRGLAMMLTIPFVLYGIFRYLFLVHRRDAGGSPEQVLLRDRPLLLNVLLWVVASALILYLA